MRGYSTALMIAAVFSLAAGAAPADARVRCPEGRTFSGKCIDPGLAQMNRQSVTAFTQTKFSYTAPPFLPNQDRFHKTPPHYHEVNTLFTFPPVTTRVPGTFINPQIFVPTPRP